MKKLIIAVVVLIVGVSLIVLMKGINKEDALQVQVEMAQRAAIEQRVRATGKIQSSTQVKISADISARITRLHVKEGDQVEKDQLLVELDATRRAASLASQDALLKVAQDEARLALAK